MKGKCKSDGNQPEESVVNFSFAGSLSVEQSDGTAVESVDDHSARGLASRHDHIYRLDVSRVRLAEKKVGREVRHRIAPPKIRA
jgi:hypothetical protein